MPVSQFTIRVWLTKMTSCLLTQFFRRRFWVLSLHRLPTRDVRLRSVVQTFSPGGIKKRRIGGWDFFDYFQQWSYNLSFLVCCHLWQCDGRVSVWSCRLFRSLCNAHNFIKHWHLFSIFWWTSKNYISEHSSLIIIHFVCFSFINFFSVFLTVAVSCFSFQEFLYANGQISALPLAFSLMSSFMSAITLLGVSAENYSFGTMFTIHNVAFGLCTPIIAYLYIPVYFNVGVKSVYQVCIKFHSDSPLRLFSRFL